MKTVFSSILFFSLLYVQAQQYSGTGGKITNNGQNTNFRLSVSGLNQPRLDSSFGLQEVCITIQHPAVQDLYIHLQSPNGEIVELSLGTSCSGANYTNTCFVYNADSSVTIASAPYTGIYRPVGYLGRFNTGQNGNGSWTMIIQDYLAGGDSGSLISWSLQFGNMPAPPLVFTSSNLPIVIINTNNQTIDTSDILVKMGIIYNGTGQRNTVTDSWNNYNGYTTMHVRGNSTMYFEKQSYSLKTCDASENQLDVSILGMPSEHDWDLVAPYQDKSLIRDPLGYTLFRAMGHYASRFREVELIINNEYRGIYEFLEKPTRTKDRINLEKLSATDNALPAVSGGYIIKVDRPNGPGWVSLLSGLETPKNHFFYQYDYPKSDNITASQTMYIQNYLDTFETIMNATDFASLVHGYPTCINTSSFIDFLILSELSKDADTYRISSYMYKDNVSNGSGKLNAGPPWDFGIAFHNCNYGDAFDSAGWEYNLTDTVYPMPDWWSRFASDSNFVNNLYCRWNDLRQNILGLNFLYNYIDSCVAAFNEAEQRNFIQWPVLGAYIWPNPQPEGKATYATEVEDVKSWIAKRIKWMDMVIQGRCISLSGIQDIVWQNNFTTYPNPFSGSLLTHYAVEQNSKVRLQLFNELGIEVIRVVDRIQPPGNYQNEISTEKLAAGIYNLQLTVNDQSSCHKLIKLN